MGPSDGFGVGLTVPVGAVVGPIDGLGLGAGESVGASLRSGAGDGAPFCAVVTCISRLPRIAIPALPSSRA